MIGAAFCPHPPLLFPEVSVTAPEWLDNLRGACAASVAALLRRGPDIVVVVGAGSATGDETMGGTLRRYGVDARAGGASPGLPLSLTTGARLLDDAGWSGRRRYAGVDPTASPEACAALGRALPESAPRVGLLVMADGTAKRTTEAPGYLDERSGAFDRAALAGLSGPNAEALVALDPALADELWTAGRPAWQVAAGSLAASGAPIEARVRYDAAPRGVGYFVVNWRVVDDPSA